MVAGSRVAVERAFARELARAAGGALIFALPLLMTEEMWHLGAALDRFRLLVLLALTPPLLAGLCRYIGFRRDLGWCSAALDGLVAYAVGATVAAATLALLGRLDQPSAASAGTIALLAVPAAIGAALARGQLGGEPDPAEDPNAARPGYAAELVLMAAGALFLTLNIAPTMEVEELARGLGPARALLTVAASLFLLEAFVYALGFSGQEERRGGQRRRELLSFTVAGYALAFLISLLMLWVLGRTDGEAVTAVVRMAVVLALPASLGIAAARLIL